MAQIKFDGLDMVLGTVSRMEESVNEETASQMLTAGAAVMIDAQKAAIKQCGLIDTGDMYASVGPTKIKETSDGQYYIDVYPQGKDRKGVRNADKFYINHFGKSSKPGTHVLTIAQEKGSEPALAAMYKVWEGKKNGSDTA